MNKTIFRSLVAACAISMLGATAGAQQQPGSPPDQQLGEQPQAAQPEAQQRQQTEQPEAQQQQEGEQRFEARRVTPSDRAQGRASVQDYLVGKLMLANMAEIELGQMASEKAQHSEVKQYAEKLISDHQQFNQKLQQLASGTSQARDSARIGDEASQDAERREAAEQREDRPQRDTTARRGEAAEDQPRVGQPQLGGESVPMQLAQITQQASQQHLQMTKQMLQEKSGEEFDMAFVGLQIAGHTALLAELQAMNDAGSPEFQQLVSEAEPKVAEHLDSAKQLAKTLSGERETTSQRTETRRGDTGATSQPSQRGEQDESQR